MDKKRMLKTAAVALGAAGAVGLGGVTVSAMSVQQIAQAAVPVANANGLYPSVMIAQAILESGGGNSQLASQYNNFFGVKYISGDGVSLPTTEYVDGVPETVMQRFQTYASPEASFQAQAALLRSDFYSGTWRSNTSSYLDATEALQGRYATDPSYAAHLNAIISEYDLTAYDGGAYTAPAAATTSTGATAKTYTVVAGDTLTGIASYYGLSVSQLAALNGISSANSIHIGQVLTLTGSAPSSSVTNASATGIYTVQSGDSLWSIAQHNGLTATQLAAMNGISPDAILQIGQHLTLTGDSAAPSASSEYTVRAGDSLWSIAKAYGTSVSQLAAQNGLSATNSIAVGQTLIV
ncbi:MAG: LysM peptidoglycan-binding domain-containing protein [Streptococcaceae bacterium]|jgi:N-acetylmuramoyl-L-alanine amidase|nr:LysM peptidoglycan-binding domain-containing protein [Streptococcaceae bacterium]